jgi:hypothetical protein
MGSGHPGQPGRHDLDDDDEIETSHPGVDDNHRANGAGDDAVIARLAALSELDYLRQQKAAAEQLGITSLGALDKAVQAARRRAQQAAQAAAREARAAEQDARKRAREAEQQAKKLAREAEQEAKRQAREAKRKAREGEQHDGFVILDQEKPRFVNVLALVKHIKATPAWHDALRHNQFTGDYEISGSFPPDGGPKDVLRPFEDPKDTLLVTLYFQANGFARASKTTSFDAIAHVALEHPYHPIRDYLNRLRWGGTERVSLLFQKYFSAELPADQHERDSHVAYLEHISTCFMVGAVARIMQPGCKHDHVPVIVDPSQGTGKSLAIRELCSDPTWFTDNIPANLQDKDTKDALRGKWIVELSETPHVAKAVEQLKAFLSSQVDRYRPAYGRTTKDHPRQGGVHRHQQRPRIHRRDRQSPVLAVHQHRADRRRGHHPRPRSTLGRSREALSRRHPVVVATQHRGDRPGEAGGLPEARRLGRGHRRVDRKTWRQPIHHGRPVRKGHRHCPLPRNRLHRDRRRNARRALPRQARVPQEAMHAEWEKSRLVAAT